MPISLFSNGRRFGPTICLDRTPVMTSMARMFRLSAESIVVPQMIRALGSMRE